MHRDLTPLLLPRSVAVVGASPREGSVAGEILRNLKRCKFCGALFPVNPKYEAVEGFRCYPGIEALPETVDLAILAINRNLVLDAVAECGKKGVRNLVVITAGFKEIGEEGVQREEMLRKLIAQYDLNVVGPNCMGIINSSSKVRLNASFSRWFPPGREIAFVSQSGSLGETFLECFEDAGLGVSLFVNLGNRAGVTENDFLAHLAADEDCRAIFLYLESFAEPTGFRSLVEKIGRTKPIVVLKAGRTEAGAAAVASHTGSLASADAVVDAFLRQCGAIRVTTIEETLTALRALERGVLPSGKRVVILTNAGGAGIIAADACEQSGLDVPPLDEATRKRLSTFLPPEAGLGNPVDMIATAGASDYEKSLEISLEAADAAIVIFRPPLVLKDPAKEVAEGISRVAQQAAVKPVLVCTLSRDVTPSVEFLREARIPVYAMPETAVDALAVLQRAREVRNTGSDESPPSTYDSTRANNVIQRALADGRTGLFFAEGAELLSAYGIPVCSFTYAASLEEARAFAVEVGFPVVAKVDAPDLQHRFEQGAVVTGIEDATKLAEAVDHLGRILDRLSLTNGRILVQKALKGRELIFGLERDSTFGPVAMFGVGGTLVEALKDVSFGVSPVDEGQALQMIRSIRAFPLLGTFRGQAAVELPPLARSLAALAQLGLDVPEIVEVDLNPIIVTDEEAVAVDILIRLDKQTVA